MTDSIIIRDLRVRAVVGVNRWEKAAPQVVGVDLEIGMDGAKAAAADEIAATVDYKRVSRDIAALAESRRYELIETLAEAIASLVLEARGAQWVRVTARKPFALRNARDVGVVIERKGG
ncbi:MAG: dihydroneopterin aldolase [Gammaproteobacteria bacterium]|nr:dihydroneopterin aldolase [Gammaproteobacteria bacterium]MCY4165925.1 dihydroneopterin aldolase [Gammaproteobacteria bacterium]MCY4255610.1 dihydroneopterin aldolase [Gammaproteobacteria bacterium]MCY4341609.1 dihydroneopterin aldolase [Gammaproteobacteria bacterium]